MVRFPILYTLYAGTVFLSSFLLFQVQPLMGKHLLPWFGGSSAVWITAMFFFMVVLAVGYVYALFLSSCTRRVQILIHGSLLVLVASSLYVHATQWPSAITPGFYDLAIQGLDPVWAVSLVLLTGVGLPFVLLSSSSSLLQFWYGTVTKREPFSLYGISNAGSLLGLLSYPLVFERFLITYAQGWWWTVGVSLYIFLIALILFLYARRISFGEVLVSVSTMESSVANADTHSKEEEKIEIKRFIWWTFVASIPVATMLAGTSFITGYVASVPFLWIIPLGLYLISFIVSFRGGIRLPEIFSYVSAMLFSFFALIAVINVAVSVPFTLIAIFLAMFSVYHLCHETLYLNRPTTKHLTLFYVALSVGGIVASMAILGLTYLLPIPIELILILSGVGVFSIVWLVIKRREELADMPGVVRYGLEFIAIMLVAVVALHIYNTTRYAVEMERNFFGYKAVLEVAQQNGVVRRTLVHGTTNHGYQILDEQYKGVPLAYYSESSGVAKGFAYLRDARSGGLKVGVTGLGAGALAGHCQTDDIFVFYEIDPQVVDMAYSWFTYLDDCSGSEVQLGDARILLESEAEKGVSLYDYLILDAYADDMMPIHLMTTEAIASYLPLLAEDGVLALHISSRYLDLLPVVAGLAEANELEARYLHDTDQAEYAVSSIWTLLAKKDVFIHEAFQSTERFDDITPLYWTDTYSSLLPILKW